MGTNRPGTRAVRPFAPSPAGDPSRLLPIWCGGRGRTLDCRERDHASAHRRATWVLGLVTPLGDSCTAAHGDRRCLLSPERSHGSARRPDAPAPQRGGRPGSSSGGAGRRRARRADGSAALGLRRHDDAHPGSLRGRRQREGRRHRRTPAGPRRAPTRHDPQARGREGLRAQRRPHPPHAPRPRHRQGDPPRDGREPLGRVRRRRPGRDRRHDLLGAVDHAALGDVRPDEAPARRTQRHRAAPRDRRRIGCGRDLPVGHVPLRHRRRAGARHTSGRHPRHGSVARRHDPPRGRRPGG